MPDLALATRVVGDALELELAFDHPMESGERADGRGVAIPAHHLVSVALTANGKPLATLALGAAVARHPVLTFALPDTLAGATLAVEWLDNRGERGTRTLTIDAGADSEK